MLDAALERQYLQELESDKTENGQAKGPIQTEGMSDEEKIRTAIQQAAPMMGLTPMQAEMEIQLRLEKLRAAKAEKENGS